MRFDLRAQVLHVPAGYDLVCFLPVGIAESEPKTPAKKAFGDRAWFNGFALGDE